jgi:heme/copper-type cytochrome/quinol oxidase subunit 2
MSIQLFQILIITFLILAPLIALVDVLRNDFKNNINKVVWVLVVILLPVLGAILYFTIGYKQKLL